MFAYGYIHVCLPFCSSYHMTMITYVFFYIGMLILVYHMTDYLRGLFLFLH
jgi:hypothetical protein